MNNAGFGKTMKNIRNHRDVIITKLSHNNFFVKFISTRHEKKNK